MFEEPTTTSLIVVAAIAGGFGLVSVLLQIVVVQMGRAQRDGLHGLKRWNEAQDGRIGYLEQTAVTEARCHERHEPIARKLDNEVTKELKQIHGRLVAIETQMVADADE